MPEPMCSSFRLAIADPKGSPEYHRMGWRGLSPESEDGYYHSPVELCAFAECTGGSFFGCHTNRDSLFATTCLSIPKDMRAVLLLVQQMPRCARLIDRYHRAGKTVVITFTEAGTMQIAKMLDGPRRLRGFFEVCRRADGAIAVTSEGAAVLRAGGARHVELIPNPCPVDLPNWDFSVAADKRRGILIGTTYFHADERNHMAALMSIRKLAESTGERVTVVIDRTDRYDREMQEVLTAWWPDELLRIEIGPLPFLKFLRLMATHKLVFQLDQAAGCGQIGGLALLCRMPCVGGYGAHERVIFPHLCGYGRDVAELVEIAGQLLTDPAAADRAMTKALALAQQHAAYGVIRPRLEALFAMLGRSP